MKKLILLLILCIFTFNTLSIKAEEANQKSISKEAQNLSAGNFEKIVWERASIRKYTNKKVDKETINKILELVNRAPSAGNLQSYKIYVLTGEESIKKLDEACNGQLTKFGAPQSFVFVSLPDVSGNKFGEKGKDFFALQDATIAAAYSQLAIQYYGLGSVWKGGFKPELVSKALNLPDNEKPVAIIPFGYPDEKPAELKSRKPLDELVKLLDQ